MAAVDNPLPSLPNAAVRAMSAAHVHVRYARLLLWPATLSADYSFNCVPMVLDVWDGRNLAAASLYIGLAWVALATLQAARGSDTQHLSEHLSAHPSAYLSAHPSAHPSAHLSAQHPAQHPAQHSAALSPA